MGHELHWSESDLEKSGYELQNDGTYKKKPVVHSIPSFPKPEAKPPQGRQPRERNGLNQMATNIATNPWPNGELEARGQVLEMAKEAGNLVWKNRHDNTSIVFDIVPFAAPRMTRSDKWKTDPNNSDPKKRQRLCVKRYFDFRQQLQRQAKEQSYTLTEKLDITFYMPMPESWSAKKKGRMNLTPHQVRLDTDNLIKSFLDSLAEQDGFVWDIHARKFWSEKGQIVINK